MKTLAKIIRLTITVCLLATSYYSVAQCGSTVQLNSKHVNTCTTNDTLTVNSTLLPTKIVWKKNGTTVSVANDTTVADSISVIVGQYNLYGTDSIHLGNPFSIARDHHGNLYVSDVGSNRIIKFPPNSTPTTPGVTVVRNLNYPQGIFIDDSDYLYVTDFGNYKLLKYPPNCTTSSTGVVVADGLSGPWTMGAFQPVAVYVDSARNMYVSDFSGNRIVIFPPNTVNATSGTVVAGIGTVNTGALNEFEPSCVAFDKLGNMYVADFYYSRVLKFPPNSNASTLGKVVVNHDNTGNNSLLYQPNCITLNDTGNLYVANSYNVLKFPPNVHDSINPIATYTNTILLPTWVLLDSSNNLFICDQNNQCVDEIPVSINNKLVPTARGTYNATLYFAGGCTVTTNSTVEPESIINASLSYTYHWSCSDTLTATVTGGVPPYQYHWNGHTGATTMLLTNVCSAQADTLVITDSTGCSVTFRATQATQPSQVCYSFDNFTTSSADQHTFNHYGNGNSGVLQDWYVTNGTPCVYHSGDFVGMNAYDGTQFALMSICTGSHYSEGIALKYFFQQTDSFSVSMAIRTRMDSSNPNYLLPDTINIQYVLLDTLPNYPYNYNVGCSATPDIPSNALVVDSVKRFYSNNWQIVSFKVKNLPQNYRYLWLRASYYGDSSTTTILGIDSFCVKPLPASLSLSATALVTNALCHGQCNGRIAVTPISGTPPYTHHWNNGATGSIDSLLCAGIYIDTVRDANNGVYIFRDTITQPSQIQVTSIIHNATIYGVCNGRDTAIVTGGTPPYMHYWSNGTRGYIDSLLCAGYYVDTVRDANGCIATSADTITQPARLIAASSYKQNITCYGLCNGRDSVLITGGVPPYTNHWSTGATSNPATNICAGFIADTIKDANGASAIFHDTIRQPAQLIVTLTYSNASAFGVCDGRDTATRVGGTAPYAFVWSNGVVGQSLQTNLCAGNYCVTVTDTLGCAASACDTITQPPQNAPLTATSNISNATCNGQCNGRIAVTPTGGTPPYTHHWSNGASGSIDSLLCAGVYTDTVRDANNGIYLLQSTVSQPTPLNISLTQTNASAPGVCDGRITVIATGGLGPYTFVFSNGATNIALVTGLCAGTYCVTVTDANNCQVTSCDTITQPAPSVQQCYSFDNFVTSSTDQHTFNHYGNGHSGPLQDWYVTSGTPCVYHNGDLAGLNAYDGSQFALMSICNGVNSSEGIALKYPFLQADSFRVTMAVRTWVDTAGNLFSIQDPINVQYVLLDTLPSYTYNYGVGCSATPALPASGIVVDSLYNFISNTWQIVSFTVRNLPSNQQYLWIRSNFTSGANSFTTILAVDSLCVTPLYGPLSATAYVQNIRCHGGPCDGSITVSTTGGTPPYTHHWNTGSTINIDTSLCPGVYSDTIIDANGGIYVFTDTVKQPDSLVANVFVLQNVSAHGACDGVVVCVPSGGTYNPVAPPPPGCSYCWSSSGGGGGYNYFWTNGAIDSGALTDTLRNLCAGQYCLTVTDANTCTASACSGNVTQPSSTLSATISQYKPSCGITSCDGLIEVTPTGGIPPYSHHWGSTNNQYLVVNYSIYGMIQSACPDIYTDTIIDSLGAIFIVTDTLGRNLALNVSLITVNDSCQGGCNGSITAFVSGGTPGYHYLWNYFQGDTTSSIHNLCAGGNLLLVTDSYNCHVLVTDSIHNSLGACDVWPGDANADGIANNFDILTLGLAYQDTGSVRPNASNTWIGQPCPPWVNSTLGVNTNNADCDGNGIVDGNDTIPILLNYGQTHQKTANRQRNPGAIPLYLTITNAPVAAGDTAKFNINLGDSAIQASHIYGIAFSLLYNPNRVVGGSLKDHFVNSWLGNLTTNVLTLSKPLPAQAQLDLGITRTDHIGRTGAGTIGTFSIITIDNISGKDSVLYGNLIFDIENVRANDSLGNPIVIDAISDTLNFTDTIHVGIEPMNQQPLVNIYPNPATEKVNIVSTKVMSGYTLFAIDGSEVLHREGINSKQTQLSVEGFSKGIYLLQLYYGDYKVIRRITVL